MAIFTGPGGHKIFRGNAQGIGNAVDVVEVGGNLDNIVNFLMAVAAALQGLNIGLRHIGWRQS